MNDMPKGIPDYDEFARMNINERKELLTSLASAHDRQIRALAIPLLVTVFEHDNAPDVRQIAREMLEKRGIHAHVEGGDGVDESQLRPRSDFPVTDGLSSTCDQSIAESGATVYYINDDMNLAFESPFSGPKTIQGGTGKPVARNQNFPTVFILHKGNEKYLRGESDKPTNSTLLGIVLVLVMMGVGFGVFIFSPLNSMTTNIGAVIALLGLISGAALYNAIRDHYRRSYLAAHGVILVAQIISSHLRVGESQKKRSGSYNLDIICRVKRPDGKVFNTEGAGSRHTILPNPGTAVAVLYVNEKNYMVL